MLERRSFPAKGIGMSGYSARFYVVPVIFGLACIVALLVNLPSWIKMYLHTELDTTLIVVSIKPALFPGYITIFRQRRKRPASGLKQGLLDWIFKTIKNRLAAKNRAVSGNVRGVQRGPDSKVVNSKRDAGKARQEPEETEHRILGTVAAYKQLVDRAIENMEVAKLSIQGRIGLDDPFKTALLCGSLSAMSGIFAKPFRRNQACRIRFAPVYHMPYFALKVDTVVRVSLLTGLRFVLFVKHVIVSRP